MATNGAVSAEDGAQNGGEKGQEAPPELPADVLAKLKKLATLESKYKGTVYSHQWNAARCVARSFGHQLGRKR